MVSTAITKIEDQSKDKLTATGRTIEEDTARWLHAKLEELLRVLDRILDKLLEFLLHSLQTSDVLPGDGRDFDDRLANGGRGRLAHREPEVLHGDGEAVEDLGVDGLVFEIDEVHLLADLLKGSLGAECGEVGADMAVGFGRDLNNK